MKKVGEKFFERLIARARVVNTERDLHDQEYGFATPWESGPVEYLRVAKCAIEAGIRVRDWKTVAEGYVMLEDCLKRIAAKRN